MLQLLCCYTIGLRISSFSYVSRFIFTLKVFHTCLHLNIFSPKTREETNKHSGSHTHINDENINDETPTPNGFRSN